MRREPTLFSILKLLCHHLVMKENPVDLYYHILFSLAFFFTYDFRIEIAYNPEIVDQRRNGKCRGKQK